MLVDIATRGRQKHAATIVNGGENCTRVDDQSLGGQGLLSFGLSCWRCGGLGFGLVRIEGLEQFDVLAHPIAVAPNVDDDHLTNVEVRNDGLIYDRGLRKEGVYWTFVLGFRRRRRGAAVATQARGGLAGPAEASNEVHPRRPAAAPAGPLSVTPTEPSKHKPLSVWAKLIIAAIVVYVILRTYWLVMNEGL